MASWSAFIGFVQLRSALEIFSCCTIMRPPKKLQVFANFWPQKMLQTFITLLPVLSRFISNRLFCVPHVENEVKRTPLWECCWGPRSRNWWIKEGPKRWIFGSFSETVRPRKSLYICQWSLFSIKKVCVPHVSLIFKKISPKTFGPHCVYRIYTKWLNRLQERVLYIKRKHTFHINLDRKWVVFEFNWQIMFNHKFLNYAIFYSQLT